MLKSTVEEFRQASSSSETFQQKHKVSSKLDSKYYDHKELKAFTFVSHILLQEQHNCLCLLSFHKQQPFTEHSEAFQPTPPSDGFTES